ncbi:MULTISPECIES: hypothetical protein [Streptosporangium]|uniref:Uncharacterized protein n=1 Tax=Streptosporangium brasiliense TaxID=47480 RepID=A0ABT9RNN2_9ACTN|nr:hypothetical protein [Streptosporangium brasiliense]MDP9870457.1 hypothetical protein [Streptosporangium brasiliense]
MAVYRVDQYARTFYGPNPELPSFDEQAFTAHSVAYDGIYLSWDLPAGQYGGFRLVASLDGYPRTLDDGRLVIDADAAPSSYIDAQTLPGRFHYYAIFLKINNVWVRAGTASTLHVKNHQMVDWLWRRMPIHHRLLQGSNLTVDADSNQTLARFIHMIGYGLDRVRSSMDAALTASELRTTHITTAGHLAASLGAFVPEGVTPTQARVMTIDSAYLSSERGHPDTMKAAARAASGWDLELRQTLNLLPSSDMSEQINPLFPPWDASIRYAVGAVVAVDLHLYRCLVAAYGIDQAPPGNGSNNTWWTVHTAVDDRTAAYDSGLSTQHGWSGASFTAGVIDAKAVPKIAVGVPHPVTGDRDANCLTIHNTHTAAADIAAWSLPPNPTADPMIPVQYGIPLPRITVWDKTRTYRVEDLTEFRGQVYRAVRRSVGLRPDTSPEWAKNSSDRRLRLTVSAYIHQPHGTAQAAAPCFPYVTWFDEFGRTIGTRAAVASADTRVLDTFTGYPGADALAPLQGRTTEFGGKTWTSPVAGFIRDSYADGAVRPAVPGQRCLSIIDYGVKDAVVAATLATTPSGANKQGLILRYIDAANYIRASRSTLDRVQAGVVTTLATYAYPVQNGDRLSVRAAGDNFTIQINSATVATATSAFQNTATRFGIVLEA